MLCSLVQHINSTVRNLEGSPADFSWKASLAEKEFSAELNKGGKKKKKKQYKSASKLTHGQPNQSSFISYGFLSPQLCHLLPSPPLPPALPVFRTWQGGPPAWPGQCCRPCHGPESAASVSWPWLQGWPAFLSLEHIWLF